MRTFLYASVAVIAAGLAAAAERGASSGSAAVVHVAAAPATGARLTDRRGLEEAEAVLVSRDGARALLVHGEAILLQLTDVGVELLRRPPHPRDATAGGYGRVSGAPEPGVRILLERAVTWDLGSLRGARVVGENVILEDCSGRPLFRSLRAGGRNFLTGYAGGAARRFAAEVNARASCPGAALHTARG
jgi:hypothetical protein